MKNLAVSFSGGKTSGFMTTKILEVCKDKEILITFANTGQENEETLEFVKRCDEYWQKRFGKSVLWLEAITHPEYGKGQTHKVVTFETAARNGEPYEAFIAKEGIPSLAYPQCSERLKQKAMDSYKKSIGWNKHNCQTAIGIRIDEEHRRSYYGEREFNLVYPLLDWLPSDKQDVNDFWDAMPFNLELEEHEGNCKTCWKKWDMKLYLIAKESPERFTWNIRMEDKYSDVKQNRPKEDMFGPYQVPRRFFKGHKSARDILRESKNMDTYTLRKIINAQPDLTSGCTESCEPYQKQQIMF